MDENKELLKKDLQIILQLDSKMNYANIDAVKKVYTHIVEKEIFRSSLGQRYLKKLEGIISGKNTNTCVFCSKDLTDGKIICGNCLDKLTHIDSSRKEETVPAPQKVVKSVMNKENLEKTKDTAQKVLSKADEKIKTFNEKTDAKNPTSPT